MALPASVNAKKKKARRQRKSNNQEKNQQKLACEMKCLQIWLPEESLNCIHECRSSNCFEQVYGDSILEPGEVDPVRAEEFDQCHLVEISRARQKERDDRKKEIAEAKKTLE